MTGQAASLSAAYEKMRTLRASPAERRRFRRVPLGVRGRMMDGAGVEHDCRTADISPGDLRVLSAANVRVGDRIIFYLDELGRLEGKVVRASTDGEFAVVLHATPHKRERLAESLTWMMSRDRFDDGALDLRRPREGGGAAAHMTLDGGAVIEGEVIDFSLVGMAIKTSQPRPAIGTWVRIGGLDGRVARYVENGFAIDFDSRPPR